MLLEYSHAPVIDSFLEIPSSSRDLRFLLRIWQNKEKAMGLRSRKRFHDIFLKMSFDVLFFFVYSIFNPSIFCEAYLQLKWTDTRPLDHAVPTEHRRIAVFFFNINSSRLGLFYFGYWNEFRTRLVFYLEILQFNTPGNIPGIFLYSFLQLVVIDFFGRVVLVRFRPGFPWLG